MRSMIVAVLLLASAIPGITEGDVPLTEWCESAGIPGVVEKLAAEGFGTLDEVIEAELTADDLDELGLTTDEAEKFTAAFAAATAPPVVQLSTWLAELDLADSLEKFEAEGFTTLPEVVEAELTEDDLKELGLGMKARKLITIELAKLQEAAVAESETTAETKSATMPQIQMDDIIIMPNGGQMDGPNAWGTIIQTAKRTPPIETMNDLDQAIRESHEGFSEMGGAGELALATPSGVDIKTMQQAKATGPPPTVYVRHEDDNWVWPGVQVGNRQKVSLPVSKFYDMSPPPDGFSADLPEDHWSPPQEMTEEDIEKAHEAAAKREEEEIARRAKASRSKRARRKAKKEKELADKASMVELAEKEGSDTREADFVIETLSTVPKVLRVRNFLSPTETTALRQLAANQEMKDVVKQGPPGCEDTDEGCDVFRNETTTWLAPTFGHWTVVPPYAPEPLIAGINRRAAALMKLDKKMMEGMLLTQSKATQHHWAHPDFHNAMLTEDPYDVGFYEDETINKFATLTTFLNDPSTGGFKSGGELQFPMAGSYPPDAQKGCPPNMGITCGDAYTIQEYSAARGASTRAGDWVKCDRGLRIAPEAGTLIIHYNMPPQGHQDGAVDQTSFNAQCDVVMPEGEGDAVGAWRLTMPFTSRMPEKPLEQTPGSFPPPRANAKAAGAGSGQGMKVEIKDEETKSGWF